MLDFYPPINDSLFPGRRLAQKHQFCSFRLKAKGNIIALSYPSLAKEALRVIKAYPHKWTPAQENGKSISSFIRVPIRFKMP
ncbi:energy transducer TonB [Cyclobacterium plantarum]|uniref:TonB C-terminal domain-containing protein n=1 Tax=Cyclobacterium plantarum TaxID=2716263 RepID=A0ABX0H9W8_9BACT|nr:energy transducer TonB [Cyclobacterium plantarum]NHE58479.1 hypothetical protein [Cyclobacterium plantarum]